MSIQVQPKGVNVIKNNKSYNNAIIVKENIEWIQLWSHLIEFYNRVSRFIWKDKATQYAIIEDSKIISYTSITHLKTQDNNNRCIIS